MVSSAERGKYVVLEGGDGAGKTTQAQRLVGKLATEGINAILMREPGTTAFGQQMRELLLGETPRNVRANVLAFSAARAVMMDDVREELDNGKWVVSDRNFTSTIAYQGWGEGDDIERIRAVCGYAVSGTVPDLTVILDIPLEIAQKRLSDSGKSLDYFESKGREFHERVRHGYLAERAYDTVRAVGASGTEDEVAEVVWQVVDYRLIHPRWMDLYDHEQDNAARLQWEAGRLAVNLERNE